MKRWETLHDLIIKNDYKIFIEVGVADGKTSSYILKNIKDQSLRIYGIDPYEPYYFKSNRKSATNVLLTWKSSMIRDTMGDSRYKHMYLSSIEAVSSFKDNSIDIVFIDANHRPEYIMEDLRTWYPKVRSGGIMAGHDYGNPNHKDLKNVVNNFVKSVSGKLITTGDMVWYFKKI